MTSLIAALVAVATAFNPCDHVDAFVGTTNFGATNPGAVCPNGMMSVSPFNVMGSDSNVYDKDSRWWSTPYCFENSFFTGYSHVNLSGVGCPEAGSLLTMATSGALEVDYHIYGSSYTDEKASPGYYSNRLSSYDILTEVSTTTRSSIERYTFHEGQANILLNLGEGLSNETGAWVRRISDTEIEGCRLLGTFCYNPKAVFPLYFVMRVSKAPKSSGFWKKQRKMEGVEADWTPDNGKYKIYDTYGREMGGDDIGYWFTFDAAEGEQIMVQMGVSFVSTANARENLDAEQSGFDFEKVRSEASARWSEDLSRITVEGGSERDLRVFYTALYHALIHPNILNDVNGEYPCAMGPGVGKVEPGTNRYTVFSLWDTYRNLHQLMTLVFPERQVDMVRSMIGISKDWGWMPKWELFGQETFTMEGDPAIPVIADTYLKGIRDFDIEAAMAAFRKSAETPGAQNRMRPDNDPYIERGYIPLGFFAGDLSGDNSVSHALEYYVADNALSLLCHELGDEEGSRLYRQRSLGYRNYYDTEFGTLRPRNMDGSFYSPFNPNQGVNFETAPGFHEGTSWNYTFYVPHDIEGLASLMGGRKAFVSKLVKVFEEGLFDPANEPDIAYPYLFSYFKGEEWRTQKYVQKILSEYFRPEPDGIPGNDDTGTMSAWAVFSMIGFYPDCPGSPCYTLTAPSFDRVCIKVDPSLCGGNDTLVLTKEGKCSGDYQKVKSVKLGGRSASSFRVSHEDLVKAGEVRFKVY